LKAGTMRLSLWVSIGKIQMGEGRLLEPKETKVKNSCNNAGKWISNPSRLLPRSQCTHSN
jgi:hypothetical protein